MARAEAAAPLVLSIGGAESRDEIAPIVRARIPSAQIESERVWRDRLSDGVEPSALDPLRESDRLIAEARRAAAELDEPAALRRLAEAERLLSRALAVPGSSLFYAEVELQLGVTAAQLGLDGLAEASFARAARLDPRRRLLAGEAPPAVMSLAAHIFDQASAAAEGEVRIATRPIGARVFLDEVERGVAPLVVRARSGVHSLRIEAAGHVSYGALFELEEGKRPDQSVVLAIDPRVAAIERLSTLLTAATPEALARAARAALAVTSDVAAIAWLERDANHARELLFMCDRRRCEAPMRGQLGETERDVRARALSQAELDAARTWLQLGPRERSEQRADTSPAFWQRWYFWSAVAATAVGAGVLIALAAQPKPQRTLRVSVDPGDLR